MQALLRPEGVDMAVVRAPSPKRPGMSPSTLATTSHSVHTLGVLIDTLMDGGLTERMLMSRPYGGGMGLSDLQALIYTHPDVDHTLGDVSVGRRVLRYGRHEVNQELHHVRNSKMMMTIAARIGHYVWSLAEWARKRLPSTAP